jgi:hypothetical protein
MSQTPFNAQNSILSSTGGQHAMYDLLPGPNLVKPAPGRAVRIFVTSGPGTAGTLAINDCASLAAVSAANLAYAVGFATAVEGFEVLAEWPCAYGIVVTVPTGCTASVSYL